MRGAHEARPQEQILGRIARDRELGEDDEVGARTAGLLEPRNDQFAVPLEVPDRRIDLRERQCSWQFQPNSRKLGAALRTGAKLASANLVIANFRRGENVKGRCWPP